MAHAIEYTDTDTVVLRMTKEEADTLAEVLGGLWSGVHDPFWDALLTREKTTWNARSTL